MTLPFKQLQRRICGEVARPIFGGLAAQDQCIIGLCYPELEKRELWS